MFRDFLSLESAQSSLEYVLLAGGIRVVAIVIFVLYKQVGAKAGGFINSTQEETTAKESVRVSSEILNL